MDATPIWLPSLSLQYSLSCEQNPRYSSNWGSGSSQTRSGDFTLFWLRSMILDLEVLILISAASHLVTNRCTASWRSLLDEDNTTTSFAKCYPEMLRPTWLRPNDVSKKLNRICDKSVSSGDHQPPEWIRFSASNANQALAVVAQGPNGS